MVCLWALPRPSPSQVMMHFYYNENAQVSAGDCRLLPEPVTKGAPHGTFGTGQHIEGEPAGQKRCVEARIRSRACTRR